MASNLTATKTPGIYKRQTDRYGTRYVAVWLYRGRQVRRTFRTEREAREAKNRAQGAGERRPTERTSFEDYAGTWLDSYRGRTSRGFSESTRTEYRRAIEGHAVPYFGRRKLDEIEPADIRAFFSHLEAKGLTRAGVRKVRAPLSALFATAVEDRRARVNPTVGVRILMAERDEASPRRALTLEELAGLLGQIPEEWRLFFELLAHSGLRISEAVALTWADVELGERPMLDVNSQIYRGKRGRLKSSYSARKIPLSREMGRRLFRARQEARFRKDEHPAFSSGTGTVLSPSNVASRMLKPAGVRAGFLRPEADWQDPTEPESWVSFHTFRHTCASILFASGKNVKQVQEWLGHHDPGFTLRTYIHLLGEGLGDADFLDRLVVPTEPTQQDESAAVAEAV